MSFPETLLTSSVMILKIIKDSFTLSIMIRILCQVFIKRYDIQISDLHFLDSSETETSPSSSDTSSDSDSDLG